MIETTIPTIQIMCFYFSNSSYCPLSHFSFGFVCSWYIYIYISLSSYPNLSRHFLVFDDSDGTSCMYIHVSIQMKIACNIIAIFFIFSFFNKYCLFAQGDASYYDGQVATFGTCFFFFSSLFLSVCENADALPRQRYRGRNLVTKILSETPPTSPCEKKDLGRYQKANSVLI